MLSRIERLWAAAILFANGWIFALPVTEAALPIWFTPVQVVHGVFLHEALLIAYVAFALMSRGGYVPSSSRRAGSIGFLIASLGILGLLSAAANFRPLKEFVGAGRYLLLAAYFFSAIYWTRKHGPTFVLRNFLLGLVSAGAINLYYTFSISTQQLGGLPFLLGQNGPAGYLGVGVILSSWLMLERRTRWDAAIAVSSCVIGIFAVSISFSKLGMLMAAAGAIGWCFVLVRDISTPRLRRWYAVMFIGLMAILVINRDVAMHYVRGVNTFIDFKFRHIDPQSIGSRAQYFLITAEIMAGHPLFGVGYGGFYDAATATEAYKSSRSAIEDPAGGARGESNPHSSFLYYASANGLVGLLLVMMLFTMSMAVFRRALFNRGVAGKGLWLCFAFGYLIFGLTLPTLFNTGVLYLPVAVCVCACPPSFRQPRRPDHLRQHRELKKIRNVQRHVGWQPQ